MTQPPVNLSPRQRECLWLYWTQQATSKEIAGRLGIAKGTVDGYFAEAVAALGARDRREAARLVFGQPGADDTPAMTPPAVSGGDPAGVNPPLDLRSLLPLRTGAHNDLSISARLVWIFGLAVLAAIGFGALASGVHLVNGLFR